MKQLKIIFLGIFLLGLRISIFSEISLDEVVQAGRFVFYRDHADSHKYYYVPDAPRLATKPDGTPEFTLIKYIKTDGETKGGILHFLVTWGYDEAELNAAQAMLRIKDPQAKIAGPVPFKEGFFRIVSTTAGEGGLFTRRIVGEGKAPILPGQKAAVSIALTPEGASLLWESFKNPTSDVSVMFSLKFVGLTPAFQAKLKVNWDKVYSHHDVKLHAEGTIKIIKLDADIKAILDDLRQKGAIQLEVAGEDTNMQKLLDSVYAHLISMMCDKIPFLSDEIQSQPIKSKKPSLTDELPITAQFNQKKERFYYSYSNEQIEDILKGPYVSDKDEGFIQENPPCSEQNQKKSSEMRKRAEKLIQENKYNEAIDIYKNAYKICPDPIILYEIGSTYLKIYMFKPGLTYYFDFLKSMIDKKGYGEEKMEAAKKINSIYEASRYQREGNKKYDEGFESIEKNNYAEAIKKWQEAIEKWMHANELAYSPQNTLNIADGYSYIGNFVDNSKKKKESWEAALGYFLEFIDVTSKIPMIEKDAVYEYVNAAIDGLKKSLAELSEDKMTKKVEKETSKVGIESKKIIIKEIEEVDLTSKQKDLLKRVLSENLADEKSKAKIAEEKIMSDEGKKIKVEEEKAKVGEVQGEVRAESKEETRTISEKIDEEKKGSLKTGVTREKKPESSQAMEIKPIITVQLGYAFKRIKLSGNYEVDLRKRLREDRDIVMSGNISGVFQKYGEDSRFFTIVSLDDPAFQERTIEVILDGQDASDFKNYINSVSVIFRKERFSGPAVTGEVKFFEEQFNRTGNRLTFKYSRLNEAATEWLYYEYKPKWSFYGGIQWEGEWVKTSDSVLTLSPPVRRRTIQITADEENMLKNNIRALALQIKHQIFGTEVIKEVIIDYFKGDPLEAEYTYLHEEGSFAYSYKIIWLLQDGREIQTNWINKESPFIYAIYAGR